MPLWLQHLLVFAIVLACGAFAVRQGVRSLTLRKGKLGTCCAKGCDAELPSAAVFVTSDSIRVIRKSR
jgi:hypothetical protein